MPEADRHAAPINIEVEQALLGAVLLNNAAYDRVVGLVKPEHFFEPVHQRIFEEAAHNISEGRVVNPVTLRASLPDIDIAAGMKLSQYLARLTAEATTVINAIDYADQIRSLAGVRAAINLASRLAGAQEQGAYPGDLIKEFFRQADELRLEYMETGRLESTTSAAEAMDDLNEHITLVLQGKAVPGRITTGLPELDNIMGGFYRGDLVLLGGRPGAGKTTLGQAIARAAARDGHGSGMFSLEMPKRHISARMMADECCTGLLSDNIDYSQIVSGNVSPHQQQRIVNATYAMRQQPFLLDASSSLTLGALGAKIRGMKNAMRSRWDRDLEMVVVDYLKFIEAPDRYRGDRVREVGDISKGLKQIAKDEGICVVALSQLSRKVEERANKRPELADLRESGDLEQDADVVLFVYRDAYYLGHHPDLNKNPDLQARLMACFNDIEVDCAKNRMGRTGRVTAWCNMGTSSVRSNLIPGARQSAPQGVNEEAAAELGRFA